MFELTGALSHVLPIMISVLVSKWTGDALGRAGVYAAWIAARAYPALPRDARPDGGEAAGARMRPVRECVLLVEDTHELEDVRDMCARYAFEGFPLVTEGGHLLGYVERRRLREAVGTCSLCFFVHLMG
jgi:chloride channel 3/4/5